VKNTAFFLVCLVILFINISIFATQSDLSVYALQIYPGTDGVFKVGEEIAIRCITLKEGVPESNWSSMLKVNGVIIKEWIGISKSNGAWPSYKILKPGKNEVECILDYKNEVAESDETNNKATDIFNAVVGLKDNSIIQNNNVQKHFPNTLNGKIPDKNANWTITRLESIPKCYTPPKPRQPEFNYILKFEFKSLPEAIQENILVISGKYVSNKETSSKPPLDLSALAAAWGDGGTFSIDWDGDEFILKKVNSQHFILTKNDAKLGPDIEGDIIIIVQAQSKDGCGVYYTDNKKLVIKPCLKLDTSLHK